MNHKAIVYSCSGCSSVAQLANALALKLDREGLAQMSCIVGVGGDVPSLVSLARSGKPIVAIDGCALQCVKACLSRYNIEASWHILLSDWGLKKRYHADYDRAEFEAAYQKLQSLITSPTEPPNFTNKCCKPPIP